MRSADPPFSRIDLISCRNLLIYMEPVLQRRIVPILHYALKPPAFCASAARRRSAPITSCSNPRTPRTRSTPRNRSRCASISATRWCPHSPHPPDRPPPAWRDTDRDPPAGSAARGRPRAAQPHVPPGVLVTADLEILQYRGDTGLYLTPAPGKASLNVLKMLREGLLVSLRAILRGRARKTRRSASESARQDQRRLPRHLRECDTGRAQRRGRALLLDSVRAARSARGRRAHAGPRAAPGRAPSGRRSSATRRHRRSRSPG